MSITQALGNAMRGLTANSLSAELTSRNIANAADEGYAARSLQLSQTVNGETGSGVRIDGITRAGDPMLTGSRRDAEARADLQNSRSQTMRSVSDLLGVAGPGGDLERRYADFESALRNLADTPESPTTRLAAATKADALAQSFNAIHQDAHAMRLEADAEIGRMVDRVNGALTKIERLNEKIQVAVATGRDATGMMDARDREIEIVNDAVPVRVRQREGGAVELRTGSGMLLVDRAALQLDFRPSTSFDYSQSYAHPAAPSAPGLSGLHLVDPRGELLSDDLAPSGPSGAFRGGGLKAAFDVRDDILPGFTAQLDAMAADLMTRFESVAADPRPDANVAGLFTDHLGQPFDKTITATATTTADRAELVGLAGRIRLNDLANPGITPGGRDVFQTGLHAALAQPGDGAVAAGWLDAFTERTSTANGLASGLPASVGAMALVQGFQSIRATMHEGAETEAAYLQGVSQSLRESELAVTAVDTDAELQRLLDIENAYAANARVLQALDEMMRTITSI